MSFSVWLCYLSIHCLSPPNWPIIIPWSENRELKPLNIFPLQSWTRWSFVRRGYWGMLKEKGVFLFMGLVCSACQAPAGSTPSPESFPGTVSQQASQPNIIREAPPCGFVPSWAILQPAHSTCSPLGALSQVSSGSHSLLTVTAAFCRVL